MKKLLLAVVLVALLAAAAFGGQAVASSKSTDISVSEETSEILFDWGGSYWGSPLRMQTDEGTITISNNSTYTNADYPQVRHVSLSLLALGLVAPDIVEIFVEMPNGILAGVDNFQVGGFHTYEFDSDNFFIVISDTDGSPVTVSYYVTTTYPR